VATVAEPSPSQPVLKLAVARAARIVRDGGVVAWPTEGVWGLGCLPLAQDAVQRIVSIKRRPPEKGFLLIAADIEQTEPLVQLPGGSVGERILATWPGPVTWVLPVRKALPFWLTGGRDTLAVRVTAHPTSQVLCRLTGSALVSTSANISGHPPLRDILRVRRLLGHDVDYVLPGALGGHEGPTEIRDGLTGRVLRAATASPSTSGTHDTPE
jgi:L-threonylcarbamoyladenylate synthase